MIKFYFLSTFISLMCMNASVNAQNQQETLKKLKTALKDTSVVECYKVNLEGMTLSCEDHLAKEKHNWSYYNTYVGDLNKVRGVARFDNYVNVVFDPNSVNAKKIYYETEDVKEYTNNRVLIEFTTSERADEIGAMFEVFMK
ncbi:MAG: hypothetical protein MRY83_14080 [Flavobacteriales bacterium]|nr:hypothetical protein [Flavobacteriales bacterium]